METDFLNWLYFTTSNWNIKQHAKFNILSQEPSEWLTYQFLTEMAGK